jgi:hypothetical protein
VCVGITPEEAEISDYFCENCRHLDVNQNQTRPPAPVVQPPVLDSGSDISVDLVASGLPGVDQLANLQRDDPMLESVIGCLETDDDDGKLVFPPKIRSLAKNSVLNTSSHVLYRKTEKGRQILVPSSLKSKVMKELHNRACAGHLGRQKTLRQNLEKLLLGRSRS